MKRRLPERMILIRRAEISKGRDMDGGGDPSTRPSIRPPVRPSIRPSIPLRSVTGIRPFWTGTRFPVRPESAIILDYDWPLIFADKERRLSPDMTDNLYVSNASHKPGKGSSAALCVCVARPSSGGKN